MFLSKRDEDKEKRMATENDIVAADRPKVYLGLSFVKGFQPQASIAGVGSAQ